jgi:hypothetical protein
VPEGLQGARGIHQGYVATARLTRNMKHESDATVASGLSNNTKSAAWLRAQAQFLALHRLSMFG